MDKSDTGKCQTKSLHPATPMTEGKNETQRAQKRNEKQKLLFHQKPKCQIKMKQNERKK